MSRRTSIGNEDVAWASGLFDGEGCINVNVNGKHAKYLLRLTVAITNPLPLPRLKNLFGGTICGPRTRNGHRPIWIWSLSMGEALPALERMLPYLTVKRDEAKVALKFPWFGRRGGGRKIDPETLNLRKEVAEELKRLKDLTRTDPFATLEEE